VNETRNDIPKPKLSVLVLTYNEEGNLPACLHSLTGVDSEIFIVDSGSTDRTKEIAMAAGAEVIEHSFETHTQQWNWALKNVPLRSEWVLGLDADQCLTPELQNEVTQLLSKENGSLQAVDGFYIKRRQVFRGRWIRHGGYYPKYLLKLFRRDKVRLDHNDLMDHHFYVDGAVAKLQHDLIEANKKEDDISFWIDKHNRYASLVAREEFHRRQNSASWSLSPSLTGNPDQRTLWFKQIWYRLPLYIRPFIYFGYRYFFRLGFLDGKVGFIFHFLQGFWFRLLVDIKIDELRETRDRTLEIRGQRSEVRR
jgi:glycosyltransferase involved in cell wall biosynthesis